jgi:hypothetical protein
VPVLLCFGERTHADFVLFEPARDCIRVTPFIFAFAIYLGNLDRTQLFLDILLDEPVPILIQSLGSESFAHDVLFEKLALSRLDLYYIL